MTVMTLYRITSASSTKSNCGSIEKHKIQEQHHVISFLRRYHLAANHSFDRMAELNKYEAKQKMSVGITI